MRSSRVGGFRSELRSTIRTFQAETLPDPPDARTEEDVAELQRAETQLVEAARIHQVGDLQRVAAYWREAVERELSLERTRSSGRGAGSTPR